MYGVQCKKDGGSELPDMQKYYIVTKDTIFPATIKGIESQLQEDKQQEFRRFIKKHKLKWKNPASLIMLLEFFNNWHGYEKYQHFTISIGLYSLRARCVVAIK